MRDKDTILLEQMYGMILEFSDAAIKKFITHFKKTAPEVSDETIVSYIKRFDKLKDKLEKKDPFQYKTFKDFETVVDANDRSMVSTEHTETDKDNLKVYEDDNLIVYKARNQSDAILLGDNEYYSFCISRKMMGNMYSGYRLRNQSTFYFIRFKKKSNKKNERGAFEDPSHYIVLDATGNGYMWTWADNGSQGHGTDFVDIEKVLKTFPELKKPYDEGIFVNDPLSEEEEKKIKLFEKLQYDFQEDKFKNLPYRLKKEYVSSGFTVKNIEILDKDLRNDYLGMGHKITDKEFKSLTPSEQNRWLKIRPQVIISPEDAARHAVLLMDNDRPIEDSIMQKICKESESSYNFAVFLMGEGIPVDERLVDAISKDPYHSYHYALRLMEHNKPENDEIMNSILKDPEYSKIFLCNSIIFGRKTDPRFLDVVIKNMQFSFEYAVFLIDHKKPVDDRLVKSIARNTSYSHRYASHLIKKNKPVDDRLIDAIAKDAHASYYFADELERMDKPVDDRIIDGMVNHPDPKHCYFYATNLVSKNKPVDDRIIEAIAKSADSYDFAEFLIKHGKPVPKIILNAQSPSNIEKLGIKEEDIKESFRYRTFKEFHRGIRKKI